MEGTVDDYLDPDAFEAISAWHDYQLGLLPSAGAMDDQTVHFARCKQHLNTLNAIIQREMMDDAKNKSANPQTASAPQVTAPQPVRRKK